MPTTGATPYTYQWKLNGTVVGSNSTEYVASGLTANTTYSVVCTTTDAIGQVVADTTSITTGP